MQGYALKHVGCKIRSETMEHPAPDLHDTVHHIYATDSVHHIRPADQPQLSSSQLQLQAPRAISDTSSILLSEGKESSDAESRNMTLISTRVAFSGFLL